jgi:hypothetical protein
VVVRTRDGRERRAVCDVGQPAVDLAEQGRRLEAKFDSLAVPVVGVARAAELRSRVHDVELLPSATMLVDAAVAAHFSR